MSTREGRFRGRREWAKKDPEAWAERRKLKWMALSEVVDIKNRSKLTSVAKKYGFTVQELARASFAQRAKTRALAFRRKAMETNAWRLQMDAEAAEAVSEALGSNEEYNRGRIGLGWLRGNAVLREESTPIGTQNNFLINIRTEEDAQRFLELGRKAAESLTEGNPDGKVALVAGADTQPDQRRRVVVAKKRHKNLQPAVDGDGA